MHLRSLRFAPCAIVLSLLVVAFDAPEAVAQQVSLPEGWANLGPAELVAAVKPIYDQGKFEALSKEDQAAVRDRGKELFQQIDIADTPLNYQTIGALHWLAKTSLDGAVVERTRAALIARQDEWKDKPYAEIRAKYILMQQLGIPLDVIVAEARRWVQAGGTIEQVPQDELAAVRSLFGNVNVIDRSFSVKWEGRLTALQTGNYTFSISPINVNSAHPRHSVRISMKVSVGGDEVINATPANWTSRSAPVSLTAADPKLVVVELQVEAREIPQGTLHSLLYWEGPGRAKEIVPATRVRVPDTTDPGFRATYTWTDRNGQPHTLTRTDLEIDFAWTTTSILLEDNPAAARQVAENVWNEVSTDEFFAWCETSGPTVKWHPYLKRIWESPASLNYSQRRQFLQQLLAHPAQLKLLGPKDAVYLYQGHRFGAEDQALEVFGKWAQANADYLSGVSPADPTFDGESRDRFHQMGVLGTQEFPEAGTRLQSEYLETPDGRCCLPVAYTLGYSYFGRGRLKEWIALLQARLSDNGLTGDKRVNWLLARAHAQEIRLGPPSPHYIPKARLSDGRGYLDEALIVAESPAVKVRVVKEISGRLALSRQTAAALKLLQQTSESLPQAERISLAEWKKQLDELTAADARSQAAKVSAARQGYLDSLRRRRERATAAGDVTATERYDALINAAESP